MTPLASSFPKGTRGSALLAALCFATILALALGSYAGLCYLTLKTSNRNALSTRSIELAETGLEEALWALNNNPTWTNWDPPTGSTITRTLPDSLSSFQYENGITGQIKLTITNYAGTPGATTTITATGISTSNDGSISRALQCVAQHASAFTNAVGATTGPIIFTTAGSADSYDSTIGYSPGDPDPTKRPGYSATIASGLDPATLPQISPVQLKAAQINGYVASAVGTLAPTFDPTATVKGPNTDPLVNVDQSRMIVLPTAYSPSTFTESSIATGPSPLDPNAIPSVLTAGNYYVTGDVALSSAVTISGAVTLYITGGLNIGTGTKIVVNNNTDINGNFISSLALHVTGDLKIDGDGIDNQTLLPKRLAIFDSATSKTIEMGTDTPFYGAIYAPNSSLTINSNTQNIYGSIVAGAVTFNGTAPQIHYDISLRNQATNPTDPAFSGVKEVYTVTSWTEIAPP